MNALCYQECPVKRVTEGPKHHFFGYYDKTPWSLDGSKLLAMENSFADRNPEMGDELVVGVVDLRGKGGFERITTTLAWNWQQGCMLKWMPGKENEVIGFNDMRDNRYVHVECDLTNGKSHTLPWALYDLSSNGEIGATLNFERITSTRPGYGYFGLPDPFESERAPEDDGIYVVDLKSGERRLIFSLAEALRYGERRPSPSDKTWFNHIKFNPSGSRMVFLHRWASGLVPGHHGFETRMFTIGSDGSSPALLVEGVGISHFDWYDDDHIVVWLWTEEPNPRFNHYFKVADPGGELEPVGKGMFEFDGHCSFSPDRRWMLTDTYPKGERREQTLILFNMLDGRRIDVGRFSAAEVPNDSWRCDLHPRWNREGDMACLDSTHENSRQMYLVDFSDLISS